MTNNIVLAKEHLNQLSSNKKKVTDLGWIYYILAKEFGITYDKFKDTPIPYIVILLEAYREKCKIEQRAAQKRR